MSPGVRWWRSGAGNSAALSRGVPQPGQALWVASVKAANRILAPVRRVLHILPHAGGGAETFIDVLEGLDGYEHQRVALSAGRTPREAALSIPRRWPAIAKRACDYDIV